MFLDGGTSIAKSPVVTRIFYAARSFSLISLIMLTSGAIRAAEPIEAAAVAPKPSLRTGSVPMEQATPLEQVLPLASGAKLITFFEPLPDNSASSTGRRDLPLLAILKDTLDDSDPGNDRIRQVWVLPIPSHPSGSGSPAGFRFCIIAPDSTAAPEQSPRARLSTSAIPRVACGRAWPWPLCRARS